MEKKFARPHVFVCILTQKVLPKVSKLNLHFKQALWASITASVCLSIGKKTVFHIDFSNRFETLVAVLTNKFVT